MKYEVELAMTRIDNCWCQKPQLNGIPCVHLLAVYSFRRLDYTQYVNPYYSIKYYINTWSSHWRSYDNKWDWPMYNDPIIMLDPAKNNKGRRMNICIPMVMDKMEGRINRLPTLGRARSSRTWFRLEYVLFIFYFYNYQNN
jgi:SWIM zinc finger